MKNPTDNDRLKAACCRLIFYCVVSGSFVPMARLDGGTAVMEREIGPFNRNLPNPKWVGNPMKVEPDVSKIVICAETNHMGGDMQPQSQPTFENNVQSRYRVSRAGNTALYLFLDGHVERLKGDRGEAYYTAHPEEINIWKWWK